MTKTWLKATLTVLTTTDLDEQRKHTFNGIAQDATDEQLAAFGKVISQAMADLAATKLFAKDGENLVAEPLAAKYVETIETPIITAPKA
ncbi:DUF2922 family protein [Lactobacillus pentosus]|jgi:uncharacterized membrane protein YheB (UPF0754 family)|uniref:DUF2922 family protein n=1 Tax=Lactiplantibacillus pentosus TaxID=1589 RepID=UPI00128E6AEA|nr:DUF2922 family protein [Lactiplantibacillus pentosus]MCH4129418.1 DUF2922 domain-containing protein [Lactiplantibacillus sp.]BBM20555.1 uncharacterized protein SN13T_0563 [Lactiplantibacillus plantarum]MCT3291802.1 DUF2922 family protein [Lactiplantibacillus pentosus]MPQ20453.1 DUF2922 family protein [Lactiplantibacillus pentosus]UXI98425.1 DUF2922 domain-containing protein [Lactiplantibacillus pentosus]